MEKSKCSDHFDKPPDPNYILSVLIEIYEREHGCKLEAVNE